MRDIGLLSTAEDKGLPNAEDDKWSFYLPFVQCFSSDSCDSE